jgi:LPXTG-motif cell wall-anchored protein
MNTNKANKIFITLFLIFTFLITSSITVNAQTIKTDNLKDMFLNIFKEGKEIDKNSVGLNDFIISPEHDYYVNVTFISSIAGYDNKLCYFVFDSDVANPEELIEFKKSEITKSETIFKSIKKTSSGTVKKIGPFKKGEKVGFYIISPEGEFYSIRSINENSNSHCAKYKDEIDGEYFVSLGFEDKVISKSDKDYNDTIFLIGVDDYTFPDVPDKDEVYPEESTEPEISESPDESEAPKETESPKETATDETISPEETATTDEAVESEESTELTEETTITEEEPVEQTESESDLPKTGEESSNTFLIIGISLLVIGLISMIIIKTKKINYKK